ncbi:3'-5' exonuclease [Xylocopilactobacillus apicola]|uniref:DNA polymerase III polC-type n=1 Tax=Xylocopilactobacillus apicola TaxID=2932184 RepID=A0AAU9CYH3_9LACO|nr:3'-5' exonuclease [Xylocopilactobacillus apicola]BDR59062.1 exonuclease [Xylocopilactobacillus apicola]
MTLNFVAIDFETGNNERSSACSLGLAVVRNSEIQDSFYSLINPPTPITPDTQKIHGISNEDVANAPTFDQIWPHIQYFFKQDCLVAAHNAPFDLGVLRATANYYNIYFEPVLSIDTVTTSRKLYPEIRRHSLDAMTRYLKIDLPHHHRSIDDAIACAQILLTQEKHFGDFVLKGMVRSF